MTTRRRIYVASSWRNKHQPRIVSLLRDCGHAVYDFRNPFHALKDGFRWSELDGGWETWTMERYRKLLLSHPTAALGFNNDFRGMQWCDTCVLVLPSGRSAHLEAGHCAGAGKRTIIHIPEMVEPELMNLLAHEITLNDDELIRAVDGHAIEAAG